MGLFIEFMAQSNTNNLILIISVYFYYIKHKLIAKLALIAFGINKNNIDKMLVK